MNGSGIQVGASPRLRDGAIAALVALLAMVLVSAPGQAQAPASPDASAATAGSSADPSGFPTIGGQALDVLTFSGPEWLARFDSDTPEEAAYIEETQALVDAAGASIEDLTVRTALHEPTPDNHAAVMAVSIDGVPAHEFAAAAVRLMLGDIAAPELLLRPVDAGWVLRVVDAAIPGVYPRTVYLEGDTAWLIDADETIVQEILPQLPAAAAPMAETDPADTLVGKLPLVMQGQRRDGLYELRDWFSLPSGQAVLQGQSDIALAQLYLDEGITPGDVTAAIAWWGEDIAEDAVQVEGFRVPGADGEAMQRFLEQVLVAGLVEAGSGSEEASLGGRDVLVVETSPELGAGTRYYFVSDDVVWVVTDFSAEQSLAEDAIASLP